MKIINPQIKSLVGVGFILFYFINEKRNRIRENQGSKEYTGGIQTGTRSS